MFDQNLYRAFVLLELFSANRIMLVDSFKKTLSKCCIDPLSRQALSVARNPTTPTFREEDSSGFDFGVTRHFQLRWK
jgi:hypothetical protein